MHKFKRDKILKCSFCGKDAGQIARLTGGPSVNICGECVGISNKISQAATP